MTAHFDKSKLPSRYVTEGPERAAQRSYYYAMGLTEEEIDRPFVGVATAWNEAAPCNISLGRQAQSVKDADFEHGWCFWEGQVGRLAGAATRCRRLATGRRH